MNAVIMLKLASQLSDFGRFSQLSDQLRGAMSSGDDDAFMRISGEQQQIKNRYKGHQPPGKMPDPNWQVAVQSPMQLGPGQTMPGYTQIDDVSGGVNRWSMGPRSLAVKGYNVPDVSKLPQGKYSMGEAAHRAWTTSPAGKVSMRPAAHGYAQLEAALALAKAYGPGQGMRAAANRSGVGLMPAMKSWRRHAQTVNPEFNQAFRRFSTPKTNPLKYLLNSAKYLRL